MGKDEIEAQQRQSWDDFSGGWAKWDQLVMDMLRPVGERMIGCLDLRPDHEHLDVAGGTGEPALTIATHVPQGRVVMSDVSPGMLTAARKNAADRGLTNLEILEAGVDPLPFDDESFDSVTCRFGLMFFPDLAESIREMRRVLRPGGRMSLAVWAGPAGNPWATIPMGAIAAEVTLPVPGPDDPSLFRCAAPGMVAELMRGAGMADVEVTDVFGALEPADPAEWWDFMTDVAAPVVAGLDKADAAGAERIRAASIAGAEAYVTDGALSLPLHALCLSGTR